MSTVHFVLPSNVDDPATPSGGNVYDRRISDGLTALGWQVREHPVRANAAEVLATLPDDSVVLVDGLLSSGIPPAQTRRLRLVILMHMPLENELERHLLAEVAAVVTTSFWSRLHLLDIYGLPADRVHAAPPGVDAAQLVPGSETGSRLLCVAAVAPHKGHDTLVAALGAIADMAWSCVCVGTLERDPGFVDRLRGLARGLAPGRVSFVGPRIGEELDAEYAAADLLVLPSRAETYGMVVTEALARGIPVVATEVNGLPEALGHAPDGNLPGILVPPADPAALAAALRGWLEDSELRVQLRRSAQHRRTTLTSWAVTSEIVASVLSRVAANVSVGL
ncbi:MAG TPA: glycosyl transferase [Micromonosporaceae bacterium]|nr:glycosyl transferase [Micromonosporaceae bacterium]